MLLERGSAAGFEVAQKLLSEVPKFQSTFVHHKAVASWRYSQSVKKKLWTIDEIHRFRTNHLSDELIAVYSRRWEN